MKKYLVVLGMAAWGCGEAYSVQTVEAFIPGVYVREFSHEFAFGYDTLELRLVRGHTYSIQKRSGYQRVREGAAPEAVRHVEKWTGLYNEREQHIMEQKRGKLLTFHPAEQKLLLGAVAYYKVKQGK